MLPNKIIKIVALLSIVCIGSSLSLTGCSDDPQPVDNTLKGAIDRHLWNNYYHDGEWDLDFEDSVFYGPAYYIREGLKQNRQEYIDRAKEAVATDAGYVDKAISDTFIYLPDHFEEVLFALLALIEYTHATGDLKYLEQIDKCLGFINTIVQSVYNDYLEVDDVDNYYGDTYGPTVNTSVVLLLNLQYAVLLDTDKKGEMIARAEDLFQAIDEKAWNGEFYLFKPEEPDKLFLYPNIVQILCHARMYQATNDSAHLERAESVFQAIQPLKMDYRPGYRSPYSAEYMGATTDDYTTFSSQNYTIFALALLAQITNKQTYHEEVQALVGFINDYLFVPEDGKVYHHWMDGHLAVPDDPEYYCSGCSLQLLYLLWWVDAHLEF